MRYDFYNVSTTPEALTTRTTLTLLSSVGQNMYTQERHKFISSPSVGMFEVRLGIGSGDKLRPLLSLFMPQNVNMLSTQILGQFPPFVCNNQLSLELPVALGRFDGIVELFGPDELFIVTAVCLLRKQLALV